MCWVKLNVFYLEESLQDLAHKFGNISSNRKDISIFIQMLQELRFNLNSVVSLFLFFFPQFFPVCNSNPLVLHAITMIKKKKKKINI